MCGGARAKGRLRWSLRSLFDQDGIGLNLGKPTIAALDRLLGRTYPYSRMESARRAHHSVATDCFLDETLHNDVVIAVAGRSILSTDSSY
jgi:hypothetical protein